MVGVNSWVAHANKAVWGPDVESFRPERWLESKERVSDMERSFMSVSFPLSSATILLLYQQFLSQFGAGSRTCIGKNISLMEISKVVPELLRRFNFTLVDPNAEIEMENVWFVKQKNINCYVSIL